jgi:hypothetical protein
LIRAVGVEAVLTSVIAALKNSTGVTGLATGGIYNDVPQGTTFPYVEVTSPTTRKVDTFGRFGAETIVNVKAVSQARGDQDAMRILDQCIRTLNFATLSLQSPQASLGITWENSDRYLEVVNGIPTRHHVGIFRAWSEQTA